MTAPGNLPNVPQSCFILQSVEKERIEAATRSHCRRFCIIYLAYQPLIDSDIECESVNEKTAERELNTPSMMHT